jgi:hypothetical protein
MGGSDPRYCVSNYTWGTILELRFRGWGEDRDFPLSVSVSLDTDWCSEILSLGQGIEVRPVFFLPQLPQRVGQHDNPRQCLNDQGPIQCSSATPVPSFFGQLLQPLLRGLGLALSQYGSLAQSSLFIYKIS